MAAAQVLVGLTTINDAELLDGWSRTGATGGGGVTNPDLNPEVFIQGSNATSRLVRDAGTVGGHQYTNASETITPTDRRHFYVWMYNLANSSVETAANGGYRVYLSNGGETAYESYYVGGRDTLPLGGWKCYPASLRQNGQDRVGSFNNNLNAGSPTNVTVSGVGGQTAMSGDVSRFRNYVIDAVRIGTGLTVYNGDAGNDEANAAGISSLTDVNDATLNRYGVCEATASGATIQGKIGIGLDDTSTETYYKDQDIVILNPDKNPLAGISTFVTLSDFTGISIEGGLTTCFFTNVFFNSVDIYDKGYFSCSKGTNEPARVEVDGCTFQNWGPTTLSGFTTASNTTWISCEAITLNNGEIDNCTVETGVGGTYVFAAGTPDNISNVSFIGVNTTDSSVTGYGHAFEVTQSGEYTFTNNSFVGFDTTGSDGAVVHINGTGIAVTFNISGANANGSFTYKLTGTAIAPTFNALVNVNVTGLPVVGPTENATEIRVLSSQVGVNSELNTNGTIAINTVGSASSENHRTSTYSFQLPQGQDFDLRILNLDYVPFFLADQTANTDPTNIPVDLKIDRVYDDDTPPSGE